MSSDDDATGMREPCLSGADDPENQEPRFKSEKWRLWGVHYEPSDVYWGVKRK